MVKFKLKQNKLRSILLIILPALIVAGFVLSANLYFDVDTGLGRIMNLEDKEFKGTVYLGGMEFVSDSGEIPWINLPVSTTTASLAMSYTARIAGQNILTVYSETDGLGSVENKRIGILTTTPQYTLDLNGNFRVTATSSLAVIDSGDWQATKISPVFGGTGMTGFSRGDILVATSSTELYRLSIGSENQVLTVSADNVPVWQSPVVAESQWTLTDSYLYPNNLNWLIGIGTSTPAYSLDVDGDFRAKATSTFSARVGIGTVSPNYLFDVIGTINMTGFRMPTNASSSYILTSDVSGIGTWQAPGEVVATGDVSGSGNAGYLARFSATTTLEDSIIYESGGKIGIATTTLSAKLNLYDTGTQLRLIYGTSYYADFSVNLTGDLSISPSSGNLFVNTNSVQNILRVYSTSTEYIQLTYSGNAGILTSTIGEIEIGQAGLPVYIEQVTVLIASSSLTALTVRQNGTGNIVEFKSLFGNTGVTDNFYDETKVNATTSLAVDINAGEVKLLEKPFECGEDIVFTYKGETVTYSTVSSTNTTCWMDRNLGASQIAVNATDTLAYGDLFQWGRLDDRHQIRTSGLTALEATVNDNVPGHSNFIRTNVAPYDWRIPQNPNLWQPATNTNNPCPSGWSVPTETEWNTEMSSWSPLYAAGAYGSPLKLTMAGYQSYSTGSLINVGTYGYYWGSTVSGTNARHLYFYSTGAGMGSNGRAGGMTVRCLKD